MDFSILYASDWLKIHRGFKPDCMLLLNLAWDMGVHVKLENRDKKMLCVFLNQKKGFGQVTYCYIWRDLQKVNSSGISWYLWRQNFFAPVVPDLADLYELIHWLDFFCSQKESSLGSNSKDNSCFVIMNQWMAQPMNGGIDRWDFVKLDTKIFFKKLSP